MDLDRDPLGLSKDAMRAIGYRTVDLLVDRLTDPDIPAMRRGSVEDLRRRLTLDRGAGFGYARTASVVAKSPVRPLVLPASALDELLRYAPDLDRRLRAAARERVARI